MKEKKKRHTRLKVLRTGDPRSQFVNSTAKEILEKLGRPKYLLSSSSKTKKGEKIGVLTKVLYLTSGLFCPGASKGCLASCLGHSSGFMKEQRATDARDRRSALFIEDRDAFIAMLKMELHEHCYNAQTQGMTPAVRLNGTSDLIWEELHPEIFSEFENIMFYDYTKLLYRMVGFSIGKNAPGGPSAAKWPRNYHLTFSLSERNAHQASEALSNGCNVAAVFAGKLPERWLNFPVINGDESDVRFLDPSPETGGPVIVGLSAKGFVAQDEDRTGFIIRPDGPATTLLPKLTSAA